MTLKQLEIFVAVAQRKSLTEASESLYMTQPAVSLAIKDLETETGLPLFKRIKQRLKITEEGKTFLEYALRTLNSFTALEDYAKGACRKPVLSLACSLSLGSQWLPRIMASYPEPQGFKLTYRITSSEKVAQGLKEGKFDLGIIEGPFEQGSFEVASLGRDHLSFVCAKNFLQADKLKISDLSSYPLLLREKGSGTRDSFEAVMKEEGIECQPLLETDANDSLLQFALAGFGLGVLPYSVVKEKLKKGEIKEVKIEGFTFSRKLSLLTLKGKALSPAAEDLRAFLEKEFKKIS